MEAEDDISRQVREQFGFCAQLLAQKAYRDYFDTCLCSQSKSAPPHRGNRDLYADRLKKSSADRPAAAETTVSIRVAGTLADISFRPETGGSTQHWKLEDGLWCRTP